MRLSRTIAQVVYGRGKEEAEQIARQVHSVDTEAVETDLWVLESLVDPSPSELLASSGIAIMSESCENIFPLPGSEKSGS